MSETGSIGAVIVAAGRGERAGNRQDGPKQYRSIGGRAVLARTLEAFRNNPQIAKTVVVIHRDDHELFTRAIEQTDGPGSLIVVEGGAERQQSVLNGLEALESAKLGHVLIHDGVRPFVSNELIDRVIGTLQSGEQAALPVIAVSDTLKKSEAAKHVDGTVPRSGLYGAQTPQGFSYRDILDAHRAAAEANKSDFTDDCSIAEWVGLPVALIDGEPENVKLTTARDINVADEKLTFATAGTHLPDVRTGNGYDVHALVAGDHVTLCGVDIPHDHGLSGHSDADVALHALTDALLATCGLGDIGDHFPPSDSQWAGASSHIFLEHAAGLVAENGGTVMNADVTLICEAPKIGPHRADMRSKLAEILGIAVERCSVKATTNEKIGFIGRREGIAAIATATVIYRSNPNG
ncbi:bifunctional 2-C-methyl-D-erythritol 4-phosphate cytidylyltransferase/2-C-methyl-D-erythritol 2,4-cyclodiphosphate synthase [Hoeflea poritis]|uniref:Bifunctional enzyme IspD/IspF n=1 Tax=Hoeflea poritis TaxID=2993659 RepID=A0ABT4VGA2_9HYPH|nr:bifunctional 2-C-methyl-D-erythritol 4-phosphate cytidylyltransferase/2-C-methyl-D-erythritol 2,4-cyclodiphosphate synthase [Hoeflea poritis]MDA4843732.1 bifunctional 2-C-methyl-D-erythritol 4-phosphate cytidylyltransferase/2-C-methyl-D-erythritol 2,4-cyclodiphosphate synthase [Hoeflea poritis]